MGTSGSSRALAGSWASAMMIGDWEGGWPDYSRHVIFSVIPKPKAVELISIPAYRVVVVCLPRLDGDQEV